MSSAYGSIGRSINMVCITMQVAVFLYFEGTVMLNPDYTVERFIVNKSKQLA